MNTGLMEFDMEIIYKMPQGKEDYDRLWETSLKVRYLLDRSWRAKRKLGGIIKVDPVVDKGMEASDGLLCEWCGFTSPPNGYEMAERWHVKYQVVIPKA